MEQSPLPFSARIVSPWLEMGAYEALWCQEGTWFKSLASRFSDHPGFLPSDFVSDPETTRSFAVRVVEIFKRAGIERFGVRVNGTGDYPERLRDAEYPVELIYYRGCWDLAASRGVAIVGTRKPTDRGLEESSELARRLVKDGFTVISGLADGIDTAAHRGAIEAGGNTIAVLGTPLSGSYPPDNKDLQELIARQHLLISQVPVCRYVDGNFWVNTRFFPERNITMSALSEATIIVEAGDTSGTLTQARAALKQRGRKLFILDRCFDVPGLKWPHLYEQRGAIRVRDYSQIREHLGQTELPADPCMPAAG